MVLDEKIYWWYFIPGTIIFLPVMLSKEFFLSRMLLSVLIVFCIGFGTHLGYRLYYYLVVRSVPKRSILFLDYRLKKELRRRDFRPKDTNRVFEYFLEMKDGWELQRIKRFSTLLNLLGCVIIACGLGIISVMMNDTAFLMKYYIMFSAFAVFNFGVIWESLADMEIMLMRSNLHTIVAETKKKKLLWQRN